MEFFTIGVFNSTENEYFRKLTENNIHTFCDIRQRRGVRGADYKFVNSKYLQARLSDLGIRYVHILDLAPNNKIRQFQKEADLKSGVLKRNRHQVGPVFANTYKSEIIGKFDFSSFIEELEKEGADRVALFCVEEKNEACHRSIVANELARIGFKITNL